MHGYVDFVFVLFSVHASRSDVDVGLRTCRSAATADVHPCLCYSILRVYIVSTINTAEVSCVCTTLDAVGLQSSRVTTRSCSTRKRYIPRYRVAFRKGHDMVINDTQKNNCSAKDCAIMRLSSTVLNLLLYVHSTTEAYL
jgi:hypothetical protein